MRLIGIPTADTAFSAHIEWLLRKYADGTPPAFEARLRRLYPRVRVRERDIAGESPAWYVYRDGAWQPSDHPWWSQPGVPRVKVDPGGWLLEASATAAGILGVEAAGVEAAGLATHHVTDFVVPGTLDDFVALLEAVAVGRTLQVTVLLRPISGDVVALDLHAARADDGTIDVTFRLANEIDIGDVATPSTAARPSVTTVPRTDVAFRAYASRALDRMPEPTTEGLALRLRRLYPHSHVTANGDAWIADRDAGRGSADGIRWWEADGLARVRYDAEALILAANAAAIDLLGHELVGHHWQEFVTPGSTEQVSIMLEILAETGAAESRFRMPRGDGSLLEFDSFTEAHDGEFTTILREVPSDATGH